MNITLALAGNPNVGKSSIFNALTGSRQHVGNWPGKTVEKKEGRLRVNGHEVTIVDLPGAYSLTAYSIEEIIARDFIINERPTAVIAVVDASNLERNLYLVAQLLELERPIILALNMSDLAAEKGLAINAAELSARLGGIPVIPVVGNRSKGLDELKAAIGQLISHPAAAVIPSPYDDLLQGEIETLKTKIAANEALTAVYHPHWLAVKLLEEDSAALAAVALAAVESHQNGTSGLAAAAQAAQERILLATGEDAETLIVDQRYNFIGNVVGAAVQRPSQAVRTFSDKIDAVVTHRFWGLPIFLLMIWLVFQFTANVSGPFLDWVDGFMNETVYNWGGRFMEAVGLGETWVAALVTDGAIAGVGGVLVFVPVLFFLYFALAILEDSGYMARAAFVMDRVMRWMGLHGKSFLPMIVGFGCTVPAVYATRALEHEKDRRLTAFLATFMSCGARLPVYVIFGAAFFGAAAGNLIFGLYVLGIGVALATGLVLKHTVYKGQPLAPFIMELPPYRVPRPRDVWRQMWDRTKGFIIKAGTVILVVSMVLWLLMAIPLRSDAGSFNDVAAEDSLFGAVSEAIAPVFAPAGFGSWQMSSSLMTGLLAKELIVSAMNQIYLGDESEEEIVEPASFWAEAGEAALDLGKAAVLTGQEVVNIMPRTINLLPLVDIGELNVFSDEAEELGGSRLQMALVRAFANAAGSEAAGRVAAVAFNVFVLLYVPCTAAVAAMRQEFGWRWMLAQVGYTFAVAWLAAVIVFQIGSRLVN
jgi:ferrous iron transport protein B